MQIQKSKSIGMRMVAFFLTKGGILTIVSLEKCKTVTAKCYTETCSPQLFENLVSRTHFGFLVPPPSQCICTSDIRDAGVFGGNGSSTIGTPCI